MGARYDNIAGVQHKVSKRYDNISGVWRPVSKRYNNVAGAWRQSFSSGVAFTVTYRTSVPPNPDYYEYTAVFAEPVLVQPSDFVDVNGHGLKNYHKSMGVIIYFSDCNTKEWNSGDDFYTDDYMPYHVKFGNVDTYGNTLATPAHLTKVTIYFGYSSANGTLGNSLAGTLSVNGNTCNLTQNGELAI